MKNFDFENPPQAYREAFYAWLRSSHENLAKLHDDFLRDTGKTKYDRGCSFDEFCAGLFRETDAGRAALEKCNPERN